MADVRLDFVPPSDPDIAKLHIYESPAKEGPFLEIEVVTEIGTFPDYISYYTTALAANKNDWFAISWENDSGVVGDPSAPIQGYTGTLVYEVVKRVLLRDSSLSEQVATQAAEYAISAGLRIADPYDPSATASYRQIEGVTLLAMAQAQIASLAGGSSSGYTAGLVSQKSDSGSSGSRDTIEWLIKQANKILGLNVSYVMLLESVDVTGLNTSSSISYDQSRQAITINFE